MSLIVPTPECNQRTRMSRSIRDIVTEIQVEACIQLHVIAEHIDDMDLHIAFGIDHTSRSEILHQEVVGHHQPLAVAGQMQVMRS